MGRVESLDGALAARSLWRLLPFLLSGLMLLPVTVGLGLTLLPAFGYLPALGGDSLTLRHFSTLLAAPGLVHAVLVSLLTGIVAPLLALSITFCFLAFAAGTRLERWVQRLLAPLLAIPHAAAAFGFAFLIAPSGLLMRWVSPWLTGLSSPPDLLLVNDYWGLSLLGGLVSKEIPFLLLMSLAVLPQLDVQRRVNLARSLGYRPAVAWLKTVAPGLYPLVRLPVYAVITFASASVDVALILGPNVPYTLSVMVLQWFNDPDLSYRFVAAAGALLQLLVTLAALLLWRGGELCCVRLASPLLSNGERRRGELCIRSCGQGGVVLAVLAACGGLLALLLNAFGGLWRFPASLPGSWSMRSWERAFAELALPLGNTLLIGLLVTVLAIVLVIAVLESEQRSRVPLPAAMLLLYVPLLVPQVAFLFGLTVAAEFVRWRPDIGLVMLAHLLFVLPYVYLSLSTTYRRLDPRWSQLGATLGASPWRIFWRLRLPLLLAPCLTAAAVGLAVSVGQYLATLLSGAGRVPTLTTEAVALAAGGNRSIIAVWALLQAALPMLGFVLALSLPRLLWRNRRGMRAMY